MSKEEESEEEEESTGFLLGGILCVHSLRGSGGFGDRSFPLGSFIEGSSFVGGSGLLGGKFMVT